MKSILLMLFSSFFITTVSLGQEAILIGDLNEGSDSGASFEENTSIYYNDNIYFTANDGVHGYELMKYDGNTISLVKDINEGSNDSECQNFYILNGKLIFTANDGVHGSEFWVSDGTEAGTQLLIDLEEGAGDGVYPGFAESSQSFGLYNGELYFNGKNRAGDNEPWKTNGTANGTTIIKNIGYDSDSGSFVTGSFPDQFTVFQGNLYFGSRDGFWKTDGTPNGTVLVLNDDPDDSFGFDPNDIIATDSKMYMLQNGNLWISDGTTSGTVMIKELQQTQLNWFGPRIRDLGSFVLFPANDGITGNELWRSDGTPEGTQLVIDLYPGEEGYAPQNTVVLDGKMYYKGDSGVSGIEFFVTDGTAAGTKLVKDISEDDGSGFFLPSTIFTDGVNVYMSAGKAFNQELWVSDGTTEGTFEVEINPSGQSYPSNFLAFDGKIFFTATGEDFGREHYIYDVLSNTVELTNVELTIYPNPVENILYIHGDLPQVYEVNILDNVGRNIFTTRSASEGVDIHNLMNGIYFVSLTDVLSGKKIATSFIKK